MVGGGGRQLMRSETAAEQLAVGRSFTEIEAQRKRDKRLAAKVKASVKTKLGKPRPLEARVSQKFLAENTRIKQQLAEHRKKMRFTFRPGASRLLNAWDLVTTLALLYTAAITPFEVSFLPSNDDWTAWRDPLFIINRLLDVIFILDLGFQFFISYQVGPRPPLSLVSSHPCPLPILTFSPSNSPSLDM